MPPITDKRKWQAQYRATVEQLESIRARQLASMTCGGAEDYSISGRLRAALARATGLVGADCTAGPFPPEKAMTEESGVMAAAAEVENFCRSQGWQFCFIGGVAVQRWGMPRFTQDVDLTLLTGFGTEVHFADALLQHFQGRLSN